MTLIEIENLSYTELKDQREAVAKGIAEAPREEVNVRYQKTLESAKQRDEKLAEQGRTISSLNDAAEGAKQRCAELESALKDSKYALSQELIKSATERDGARCEIRSLETRLEETTAKLTAETARADRLKAEATRHHAALTTAEKALKDALAGQALDIAEKG